MLIVRLRWLTMLALCGLAACRAMPVPTPLPSPTSAPVTTSFRIVGYVTDWEVDVNHIQFDKLTHINYAFLIPNRDGTFAPLANAGKLKEVVAQAHAQGVNVLISVGGWGWDDEFETLAADSQTRAAFVGELAQFVQDYDLDGADIDWEYPGPEPDSAQNFVALMQALEQALKPQGKLLTAAVIASGSTGQGVSTEALTTMDFVNIMAYDGPGTQHASLAYAEDALAYWSGRGLPPEKLVLGVPFYSRPGEVPYRKLVASEAAAANGDEWLYLGGIEYYNGQPTMRAKTELALERASGVMIWALAHDTSDETSLLNVIYQVASGQAP
jgi:GH18 family chitinase